MKHSDLQKIIIATGDLFAQWAQTFILREIYECLDHMSTGFLALGRGITITTTPAQLLSLLHLEPFTLKGVQGGSSPGCKHAVVRNE